MTDTIHETMQRVLEATKDTPAEIARKANASPQNVNNWMKRGISKNGAKQVAESYGLLIDWILTGQGEMKAEPNYELNNATAISNSYRVPIINIVQAGQFTGVFDNECDEFIDVPSDFGDGVYGLRIDGFSMIPDFYPNDIVFINPNIEPINGDFVVATNQEYENTFKKYKTHFDSATNTEWFELVPSNTTSFEPIDSRKEPFKVIGVAVGEFSQFRRGRN